MPTYSHLPGGESGIGSNSAYFPSGSSMYQREIITNPRSTVSPNAAQPHSSFLIDDILGKKQRERERELEIRLQSDPARYTERQSEIERKNALQRDKERQLERSRERDRERERELQAHRDRIRAVERQRDRQLERDRELQREQDHQTHLLSVSIPKDSVSIPSPATCTTSPSSTSTILSSEIPRPTPINPAAIQTNALTTPIYKPLPTMYDPALLSQAYINPHLSAACQSSIVRQMCGGFGSLTSVHGYARPDYPAIFESQCNAFSKGKMK